MKGHCPWCEERLNHETVRQLGRVSEPCPRCGNPIKESIVQVLFVVVCLLPILASALVLSRYVYEKGNEILSFTLLLAGFGFSIYVQKHLPLVAGPTKGPKKRGTT